VQGPAGTARAYGLVGATGTVAQSMNVVSVTHTNGTGIYCIELNPSINASQTGAVVSPYFQKDSTSVSLGHVSHVEYDGACGSNGEQVVTFQAAVGSPGTLTIMDEPFFIIVP
jgi:hypothetical protein